MKISKGFSNTYLKPEKFNGYYQLEGIEGIEEKVFDFPWTKEEFDTYLRTRNQRGFLAQQDGKIVGYVLFEEGPTQIKIDNIAVDPVFLP